MAHTRRGFLARIGAAAIGLTLASKLPGIASAPPRLADKPSEVVHTGLVFHENAFAFAWDEHGQRISFGPWHA